MPYSDAMLLMPPYQNISAVGKDTLLTPKLEGGKQVGGLYSSAPISTCDESGKGLGSPSISYVVPGKADPTSLAIVPIIFKFETGDKNCGFPSSEAGFNIGLDVV